MSKIGKTKNDILKLLGKKQYTITDISNILHLSPSTVKQHFDELHAMGAIELVQNEFIKRWKYYRANPTFNLTEGSSENQFKHTIPYVVGSVVILFVIATVLLSSGIFNPTKISIIPSNTSSNIPTTQTSKYLFSIQLTDPPHVPVNTNSLVLNYSSFSINALENNGTYVWINASGSGSVNLMSLINISQIMGKTFLNSSDKIEGVALNVNSAHITIGNITYSVVVPEKQIYANLSNQTTLNSNSSVLIDFSPTVSSIYSSNSTLFVMIPSVKAIFYGNYSYDNRSDYKLGRKFNLSKREFFTILSNQNLTITSANITQYGNPSNTINSTTQISVTVKNNGNKTVILKQILISGKLISHVLINNDSAVIIQNHGFPGFPINISNISTSGMIGNHFRMVINKSINNNLNITAVQTDIQTDNMIITANGMFSSGTFGTFNNIPNDNYSIHQKGITLRYNNGINLGSTSGSYAVGMGNYRRYIRGSISGQDDPQEVVGINMVLINQFMFFISKNGRMIVPGNGPNPIPLNNIGYPLAPGASITFTFNGGISCGNGRILGSLTKDASYNLVVIGNGGSFAYKNITAK